jgi:hypothetical protein
MSDQSLSDRTFEDMMKQHLEDSDFSSGAIKEIMKTYKKSKKDNADNNTKLRHGTTCFGIVSKDHKEVVTEW